MQKPNLKIKKLEKKLLRIRIEENLKRFEKHPRKAYVIVKFNQLRIRIYRGGFHCTCSRTGWYGSLSELRKL